MQANALYAQSGGVTSVINASACGVIETIRKYPQHFKTLYAGYNGILGVLQEKLLDTSLLSDSLVANLRNTPGGIFGSCRYKLKSIENNIDEYKRLIDVFKTYNIRTFFYNGGGDSQDTANKIAQISQQLNYPIQTIGIPKTIDNDLPHTDCSPGFGSVAKYVAISTLECGLDIAAMAASSTKLFVLEVMGRHTGWIAAASGLAQNKSFTAPHLILFPEVTFNPIDFCRQVETCIATHGYCVTVAAEGIRNQNKEFVSAGQHRDAFGHAQLGGVAPYLTSLASQQLGIKTHWAVADYLQRSARHIASAVDVEQAYAVGKAAVEFAVEGKNQIMSTIIRLSDSPYKWSIGHVDLAKVANVECTLPQDFIDTSGYHITAQARQYLLPLIQGEDYPRYCQGIPDYATIYAELALKV